jgi:hypothetical protein
VIFYDGIYRLQPYGGTGKLPIRKWPYAWRVRIINRSISNPEITHLRPYIVFATPSGDGIFKTNCAESLGKKICRDFNLDVSGILWVEKLQENNENLLVAVFTPKEHFGTDVFYTVNWRPIRPNEYEILKAFIAESETIRNP